MYIKKSVLFGIVIFLLASFVVGEYFYLENKFSSPPTPAGNNEKAAAVSKENKAVVQPELSPTPFVSDIIGASSEVTVTPTIIPVLTIQQAQTYLTAVLNIKPTWQNVKDKISDADYKFLMDSFDRQISFCQTIIDHLSKNPVPSEADLELWDGVQKMWAETGELTSKLNEKLSK